MCIRSRRRHWSRTPQPSFDKLPTDNWVNDELSLVVQSSVLKARIGYAKELLIVCASVEILFDVEVRCYYLHLAHQLYKRISFTFVEINNYTPTCANWRYPAGETQIMCMLMSSILHSITNNSCRVCNVQQGPLKSLHFVF